MDTSTIERKSSSLEPAESYDLVCVGFGPASLAIAIALHDKGIKARVRFIERQKSFKWHGGMLLPDARMQISFLKDLATLRNPRSEFTFINYLKAKDRLVQFVNLSTFLPLREEFNDYMTWCASHFEDVVQYGAETVSVSPSQKRKSQTQVGSWTVLYRDVITGRSSLANSKHVVIAIGGAPKIPDSIAHLRAEPNMYHSSSYSPMTSKLREPSLGLRRIAIIGGGQSAAEIFNDLQSRFDNTAVTLYTSAPALKPSDDSPFVNEIFDPERVDSFYQLSEEAQQDNIRNHRATNYSVVRPELLDRLYESMYHQRLHEPDKGRWRHQIATSQALLGGERDRDGRIRLRFRNVSTQEDSTPASFDFVIAATGYDRNGHEKLLEPTKDLLQSNKFEVERTYRIKYQEDKVAKDSGIWLQGCCEKTHGLSDTLLSILAIRGGELVDSIFPQPVVTDL